MIKSSTTTHYSAVVPFYVYAALCFLISSVILFYNHKNFTGPYFQPSILALTHLMALGWGTMIILGASHQLIPVLIERSLFSEKLAYLSFATAATGIPLLVYNFYYFHLGLGAQAGGILINIAVLTFLVNFIMSIANDKNDNIHSIFIFTAGLWLLITTLFGLLLLFNFTSNILPSGSLTYLSLHAHFGIAGWFLLLIIGVASRLIPMFLISKYTNKPLLKIIFYLINAGLLFFIFNFNFELNLTFIPIVFISVAVVLFIFYCYKTYSERIRKKVDNPVKLSLSSVVISVIPIIILCTTLGFKQHQNVVAYGFCIFFGWITSIILGMTFKTLPFIIWNKAYKNNRVKGNNLDPKNLFSQLNFNFMFIAYLAAFIIFITGIFLLSNLLLQTGAFFMIIAAIFYNLNVFKMLSHKVK